MANTAGTSISFAHRTDDLLFTFIDSSFAHFLIWWLRCLVHTTIIVSSMIHRLLFNVHRLLFVDYLFIHRLLIMFVCCLCFLLIWMIWYDVGLDVGCYCHNLRYVGGAVALATTTLIYLCVPITVTVWRFDRLSSPGVCQPRGRVS